MPKVENTSIDPITQGKHALATYEHMKQSVSFFNDMIDFHIKQTKSVLAKLEKEEDKKFNELNPKS